MIITKTKKGFNIEVTKAEMNWLDTLLYQAIQIDDIWEGKRKPFDIYDEIFNALNGRSYTFKK